MNENPSPEEVVEPMPEMEWPKQASFVLAELQRLNKNCEQFFVLYKDQSAEMARMKEEFREEISAIKLQHVSDWSASNTEIKVIKAKAGLAGLIAGGLMSVALQLVLYFFK